MEYWVGVHNADVNFCSLMQNRLSPNLKVAGQIEILEDRKNYIKLHLKSAKWIFDLAEIFADIIMENLQTRYIMNELVSNYAYVLERDQSEILVNTLKRLWYYHAGDMDRSKEEIAHRVALCMLERKEHVLSLDGVMRFRMQDCLANWKKMLALCVDDYLLEAEKHEFIKLLRYFVSMREPMVSYVSIRFNGRQYDIFDGHGAQIIVALSGEEGETTKEDLLLSRLINLAPEAIDVCEIQDAQLKELLRKVFVGRIRNHGTWVDSP